MGSLILRDESVMLNERACVEARDVMNQISDEQVAGVSISLGDHSVEVGSEVAELIMHVIAQSAHGNRLTIASMPAELTTTAASKLLGISRPTLMKLIERNEISSFKVGSHTRLKLTELDRYRNKRIAEKRKLLREIDELSMEIGE